MLDLGAPFAFYLGLLLATWGTESGAPAGSRNPMAIPKWIALALDLGTPSSSRGPLAFDLRHQLAQRVLGSYKGASLTIDLETSLALGSNWLLIWGSI